MFCVIYRFHVRQDKEELFINSWSAVTRLLKDVHGACGSRLHKSDSNQWIAYAQWPDEQAWSATKNGPEELDQARRVMRGCLEDPAVETLFKLNVIEDQLEPICPPAVSVIQQGMV